MKPKTIVLLVIVVLSIIVLIQNSEPTKVKLVFWAIEMPLFILIISSILLGLLIGWFTHLTYFRGRNKKESIKQTTLKEETTKVVEQSKEESEKKETSAKSDEIK